MRAGFTAMGNGYFAPRRLRNGPWIRWRRSASSDIGAVADSPAGFLGPASQATLLCARKIGCRSVIPGMIGDIFRMQLKP
jgi:hypothetical protein